MNNLFKRIVLLGCIPCMAVSCTTAYDAYGRPIQTVDPAVAVAGVAAAGIAGYAIGNHNDHHHDHYRGRGYYRGDRYYRGGHRGGYYRHGRYYRY